MNESNAQIEKALHSPRAQINTLSCVAQGVQNAENSTETKIYHRKIFVIMRLAMG
jgi:hypothetical protein